MLLNNKRLIQRRNGFTLLELIISSLLIALVLLAVYTAFSNGLKIWARTNQVFMGKEQSFIALERMARDVHNIVSFSPITIDCKANYIFFPSLVNQGEETPTYRIAQVMYSFDSEQGVLNRQQQIYGVDKDPISRTMVANIKSVKWSYRHYDSESQQMTWVTELEAQAKPTAVKVEIILNSNNENDAENTLIRIISLPK